MSKCETCAKKQYGYLCDGCIHDPDNKDLYEPMTNADRIRAMTDEELAELLFQVGYDNGWGMKEYALEWLQQPAEEDGHDERKENENV